MVEKNMNYAEAYYKAMSAKDLSGMARHLHPNVHFLGPLAEMTGKKTVLEAAEQLMPLFKSLTIRAKFSYENQAMVIYDLDCPLPIGIFRVAALMTFEDDLISRIELFYDARPFEKKKDDIFSQS